MRSCEQQLAELAIFSVCGLCFHSLTEGTDLYLSDRTESQWRLPRHVYAACWHVFLTYSGDSIAADCCSAWRKSRGLQEELIAQRSLAGVVARALSRAAARSSRAFAATLAILVKPPAGFAGHSEPLVGSAGSAAHSDSRSLLPSVVVSISCCFRAQDIVRMEAVVDVGDSIGIHDPASCS
jgi:hypothetical protein